MGLNDYFTITPGQIFLMNLTQISPKILISFLKKKDKDSRKYTSNVVFQTSQDVYLILLWQLILVV